MTDPSDTTDDRAERIANSVREAESDDQSRRRFLNNSVLASGTLLALGGSTGFALASDDGGSAALDEHGGSFDDVSGTDVDVLNYALTLEHLEDAFYQTVSETFGEEDFVQSDALADWPEAIRADAWGYVQTIGEHESAHVDVLTQVVSLLGGEPAQAGSYDFGVETVGDAIGLGAVFENTGVAAYAGAAPYIESPDLLSSALSIHSVEARHAAVLNTLNGESPFPDAFDAAASQQEVLDAVSGFIEDSEMETDTGTPDGTETGTPTNTSTGDGSGNGNGDGS